MMDTRRQLSLFLAFAVLVSSSTAQAGLFDFFKSIGEGIAKVVKKVGEVVVKTGKKIGKAVAKAAKDVAKGFEQFGSNLVKGRLGTAFGRLGSAVGSIGSLIMEAGGVGAISRTVGTILEESGAFNPMGKIVDGLSAGMKGLGQMVGQAIGNTAELAGKSVMAMVQDPLRALNPIEHYKAIGLATYEFGKMYFYENQVAMVKDFINIGEAFGKGKVGEALLGILDSVENIATRNVQALGKGVGTFVGERVGNKKLGEEIAKQVTTNIQIGIGFADFILPLPVPLFGAGQYSPMSVVIGGVIGEFLDTEDLKQLPRDALGCPIDPKSRKIRANIGRGTRTFTVEQLLCNVDQKIVKKFSTAYWKTFINSGRYLVFKAKDPKGFFLVMEDADGYYNLQPDPVESGGVGASDVFYDPSDGAMLLVLTDGREIEGALGGMKAMYCFGNSGGVLVGDAQCNTALDVYAVPLKKTGAEAPTAGGALAGALSIATGAAAAAAPSAEIGEASAAGLAGALGGALATPETAGPLPAEQSTAASPAATPAPTADVAGALAGALTADVATGPAPVPEAQPAQPAAVPSDTQEPLAGALGAALAGGAS